MIDKPSTREARGDGQAFHSQVVATLPHSKITRRKGSKRPQYTGKMFEKVEITLCLYVWRDHTVPHK